ncbi:MAG: serine--tRNA ligase [archaeon]
MLDIKFVREHPDIVRRDLQRRGDDERVASLEELLRLDTEWRSVLTDLNKLRERRNVVTEEIARLRRSSQDASSKIREAETIPDLIKEAEKHVVELKERIDGILVNLPNIMHETVPEGKGEDDNLEIRRWGEIPKFSFPPKDHIDIATNLDLIDMERAAKVSGARFYYLKGDLVRLNWAIICYALDFMQDKHFTAYQPPYMLHRQAVEGAVALSDFEDVIYKIEGEDLYLLATSEHALLGLHMDEILDGTKLPLRYCGISPCFRKEAGAHGRDTKGIFRVHQFEKVEQFIFSRPEQSWNEHELMLNNAEELFQQLGLPYRIVNICSGELGTVAAKKYDLETWLPGQDKFREAVSCSNCTAYQAVRANVRFRDRSNDPTQYVHTLNSTLIASERALVAIMENYQQEDGTVLIPKVLRPYLRGLERIG